MKTALIQCGAFGQRFDFSDLAFQRALLDLPAASLRKSVLHYHNRRHQWVSLLSRKLLVSGLAALNISLNEKTTWSVANSGRPYITACPDFNISHSGKIAICAIAQGRGRVGIDVEIEKPVKETHLQQVFTDRELAWVNGEQARAARLWSRKEAVSKLLGLGMRVNFRRLETLASKVEYAGNTYYLNNVPVANGYQCTLAAESPQISQISHFHWSSLAQLDETNGLPKENPRNVMLVTSPF